MKYALAVLGLVAVVAIIAAWRIDFRVAVFGAVIILILMVSVLIFARLTQLAPRYFIAPALFFMWTFALIAAATAIALFTAATMRWPPALYELIFGKPISSVSLKPNPLAIVHCKILSDSQDLGNVLISLIFREGEPADQVWAHPPDYEARLKVAPNKSLTLTATGRNVKPNSFTNVFSPSSATEMCYGLELQPSESEQDGRCYPVESCDDLKSGGPITHGPPVPLTQTDAVVSSSTLNRDDLFDRVFIVLGSLETGASNPDSIFTDIFGNLDGQGITIGLGFTWAGGEIQAFLQVIEKQNPDLLPHIFKTEYTTLKHLLASDRGRQLQWAKSISSPRGETLIEPWLSRFRELARQKEFQELCYNALRKRLYEPALEMYRHFELRSERAVALMCDIQLQNGGIRDLAEADKQVTQVTVENRDERELRRMRLIAEYVAAKARPQYRQLSLSRKLLFVNGEGFINGVRYDLSKFGITLQDAQVAN